MTWALCGFANVFHSDNTLNNGKVKIAHQRENMAICKSAGYVQMYTARIDSDSTVKLDSAVIQWTQEYI